MDLDFFTDKEIEKNGELYLVQRALIDNNKKFHILWNLAGKEDRQALQLQCELPHNIRRFITLTSKVCRDGKLHRFAVRVIKKELEFFDNRDCLPIASNYIPRDTSKLLPYQKKCFYHLCNVIVNEGHALDASDTGLGKTYIAAAIAREFQFRPIVICKKIAISAWMKVLESFGVPPLAVVNWQFAIRGKMQFYKDGEWNVPQKTIIFFDEGHFANHDDSQNNIMYEASKKIASVTITATIADKPQRLAPLVDVLGALDKEDFKKWLKDRGEVTDDYGTRESLSDTSDMKALNNLIFPRYGFRMRYTDPDVKKYFPDAIYNTFLIPIGEQKKKEQNKHYEILLEKLNELKETKGRSSQAQRITLELRYRQMSEYLKVNTLCDMSKAYIKSGKSVVVFVNYKETLKALAKKMHTDSVIYGEQEKDGAPDRNTVIDRFQTDKSNIIIATLDAGGTSISLHDITGKHQRISLFCPTYHALHLKQAMGRTYRALSKTPPVMQLVYAAGTIEEKVARSVNSKLRNISTLNDGDLKENDIFEIDK